MLYTPLRTVEKQKNRENSSHNRTYLSRVITNTCKDHIGSTNWKLDWAKINKSYAWVLKQNKCQSIVRDKYRSVKNSERHVKKHSKYISGRSSVRTGNRDNETWGLDLSHKTTHVNKRFSKVSKANIIPIQNRFKVLNNIDNSTDNALQCVGKVKRDTLPGVFGKGKHSDGSAMNKNVKKVNAAVVCKTITTHKQSVKQTKNNLCDDSVKKSNKSTVNCAGGSDIRYVVSPKATRRCRPSVCSTTDKYELDLQFRPRHREQISSARNCNTFKLWNSQTEDKFGFIPLGDLTLPSIDLQKYSQENIFDIHRWNKVSGTHNFMQTQIQIQSQLKPDVWQKYLTNYWDSQLLLLLRYGFPLDFDYTSPLRSVNNNHSSASKYTTDVQAYLNEEKEFGAMLGPFNEAPIENIHVSPFLTRDKPGGTHRRVIVDLSFPHGYSVNAGVQSDTYLNTPFLLTLPTIDNITNKVKQLGKGCHLYKIDLSRAFRHVKLDPKDYNLLGLSLNGLYIDSCLPFGFRHGSALF